MTKFGQAAFALWALPWLTACWTPQHEGVEWIEYAFAQSRLPVDPQPDVAVALVRPTVEGTSTMPRPGDCVVYSIDVETPGRASRTYLRCTVEAYPDGLDRTQSATLTRTEADGSRTVRVHVSRTLPVRIEAVDADGDPIDESVVENAPIEFLSRGFVTSASAYFIRDDAGRPTQAALEAMTEDGPTIFSVGALLQNDSTLRGIALELVDSSLMLSAIWNLGVRLSIDLKLDNVERIERDSELGLPAYRFPVELTVNGHPALRVAITIVHPTAPHSLTAGIVRIDGFRPSDDRYRVRVRLVRPIRRAE